MISVADGKIYSNKNSISKSQAAYPYADLVDTNRGRSRAEFEYEFLDTGVFNEDKYFDVFVEYAKAGPEDILVQINRLTRKVSRLQGFYGRKLKFL